MPLLSDSDTLVGRLRAKIAASQMSEMIIVSMQVITFDGYYMNRYMNRNGAMATGQAVAIPQCLSMNFQKTVYAE